MGFGSNEVGKKFSLIIFTKTREVKKTFCILLLLLSVQHLHAQRILDITKKYYRYDPFKSSFGFFVQHLTNDPGLLEKTISKITDSTLYFFEGTYKSHAPFSFKTQKTKVVLAEREQPADSSGTGKSILLYQMAGYAPAEAGSKKMVEEEFKKFVRKYKDGFSEVTTRKFESRNNAHGEICEFNKGALPFAPLTVAWSSDKAGTENIFVITIRFVVIENRAYLPFLNQEWIPRNNADFE